ncbi:MAG: sulfatase [Armatimonadota bacterium]|nr:sulfatase [Armatimonadota bacterium]
MADTRIRRRDFLKGSLAAVAAASLLGEEAFTLSPATAPNIVLINCDDAGYSDFGCYGAELIRTPNVDALAAGGIKFTDFYACAPVCTPSRAGLLTGRYPVRVGLPRVLFPKSEKGISDSEITIAQALKSRGYATACIGKWHLGDLPQYLPTRHGFDYYCGIPYSNDMGNRPKLPKYVPLMRNEEIIEAPVDQDTLTRRYTQEAIAFIKQNKNKPFFVYLPHTMPHVPLAASDRFRGKSKRGLYGDVIEEIDWSLGEIRKALAEEGLDKNTLVIFTSDNGPWLSQGENGGSAGPLRDGKMTVFEGGMREPFIAYWPGRIRPGGICRQPASNLDMFPTLVTLAGGKVPTDRIIDGRNITKLLTGSAKMPDYPFYYYQMETLDAIRYGHYKLHINRKQKPLHKPQLYNLDLDIGEKRNIANQHPDIVADLLARIEKFKKTMPPEPVIEGN